MCNATNSCVDLTDVGVSALVHCCHELTHLNISNTSVTDAGVREIALHCTHLQNIVVEENVSITDSSVVLLTELCSPAR